MELKHALTGVLLYDSDLLIVPYGIETCSPLPGQCSHGLLIVPYGIETSLPPVNDTPLWAFNRTLWN